MTNLAVREIARAKSEGRRHSMGHRPILQRIEEPRPRIEGEGRAARNTSNMQHGALAREPRGPREAIDKKREKKSRLLLLGSWLF